MLKSISSLSEHLSLLPFLLKGRENLKGTVTDEWAGHKGPGGAGRSAGGLRSHPTSQINNPETLIKISWVDAE